MNPEKHSIDPPEAQTAVEVRDVDARLNELRTRISEAGQAIDEYKAATGMAMGGGVFLGLLAAGAGYDLVFGKAGAWQGIGITHSMLTWLAYGFGGASVTLLLTGWIRQRSSARAREATLADLELEFARLLDRKERGS
ncbi:MAG TPA: hypothetical protein VGV87_18340 [Blastocatellia bacterium]|nr:hypothetical protein [Blastocatellia bacterium]